MPNNFLNINQFSKFFHCQNQEKICNSTITRDPTTPQLCCYTPCLLQKHHNVAFFLQGQDLLFKTFYLYIFFCLCLLTSSLTSLAFGQCFSKVLFVYKEFLFPVVTFLKCVVIEVVLFSIVAFKTMIFHKVV